MKLLKNQAELTISSFAVTASPPTSSSALDSTPASAGPSSRQIIDYVSSTEVLKAEIMWALKCMDAHYSMTSCAGINDVFSAMFPDSVIARSFRCGDKKAAYLCTFGLGPYFSSELTKMVKASPYYVLCFDETLNKDFQEKQLDIHLRIWDGSRVVTQFYDSKFMGHGTAVNLFEPISTLVAQLGHRRLLQLSMDGPTVNKSLAKMVQEEVAKNSTAAPLDIGTCGLHTLNNAFLAGCTASKWDLEGLLSSAYYLFKDSPARRDDFKSVSKASLFPLKFCRHRY